MTAACSASTAAIFLQGSGRRPIRRENPIPLLPSPLKGEESREGHDDFLPPQGETVPPLLFLPFRGRVRVGVVLIGLRCLTEITGSFL